MTTTAFRSLAILGPLMGPAPLRAQLNPQPSHGFVLSGYGTAGWAKAQGVPNGFFTSVAPILLFRMTDKMFAEAELEFGLEDGATETGLEYATVHCLANDYLTVSAGKFIVPFGVFAQRIHPSWINRFTSAPPVYGGHGGVPGNDPLLPILSDIGVMASAVAPLGGVGRSVTFSAYLTNGPRTAAGHLGEEDDEPEHGARPEFDFGSASGDNNDNKMLGGRVGLVLAPNFEVDASALTSRWGHAEAGGNTGKPLAFTGYNLAAEYRPRAELELRTEWVWIRTEMEEIEGASSVIETLPQFGGYVQAAYRHGLWEPVIRFSLVDQDQSSEHGDTQFKQYGLGLNYWFSPSIAIMAAYEVNRDAFANGSDLPNNRLLVHWAFGF